MAKAARGSRKIQSKQRATFLRTQSGRTRMEALRQARQNRQLFRLANALNQSRGSESSIFEAALDAILACLDAPKASVLLLDPHGVMRFKAWRGLSRRYRRAANGHSPWAVGARNPTPFRIGDVSKAKLGMEITQAIHEEGIGALAFIPLNYNQKLVGKFMVYYTRPHRFSSAELRLAQTIANQLAVGLERKRAQAALRQVKDRLAEQARELERLVGQRTCELSEANQQLEAFVYTVAHDLRAPLRAMEGFATLLVEREAKVLSAEGLDYARRIGRSAQFLDAVLVDLLAFSRVSKQRIQLMAVDLGATVENCVARLENDIREKRGKVETIPPWPKVLAHEPTLAEAIVNLLSNALKFSRPDIPPRVRLWAESNRNLVRVWVEDNGIGIAPEHHEQIFRPFVRLESDAFPGTGIGLAIVKKGIERMHGGVGLQSIRGRGSRFWLELPQG